jgi:hypothetical protein
MEVVRQSVVIAVAGPLSVWPAPRQRLAGSRRWTRLIHQSSGVTCDHVCSFVPPMNAVYLIDRVVLGRHIPIRRTVTESLYTRTPCRVFGTRRGNSRNFGGVVKLPRLQAGA